MSGVPESLAAALADRYTIERELGAGGMATVYLAHDIRHDRKVAIKVLRPELAAVLGADRFVQEIRTTANLQHPHILPLFDSGKADSFLHYVMPYIEGETLRDKLNREKQLSIDEAIKITTEVADALDYAHRQNVIHRDIKPENILLHDGRPMVADFGIALAVSAAAGGRMTETGLSLGTPHYMSPEQATAEKDLTNRSDIYSLGAVLYEMLTGSPPHLGSTAQQIIMKIVTEQAAPVTKARKAVPPNMAAAVMQALEKLPADRFQTAAQFAAALGNPAFTTARATGATVHQGRPASLWNPLSIATTAVAAGLLVVTAWLLLSSDPEAPVVRFPVQLPEEQTLYISGPRDLLRFALTPDGSGLVFTVRGPAEGGAPSGVPHLWYRRFDELSARRLPGTEGGSAPAISDDGLLVAFVSDRQALHVASLTGGPTIEVVRSGVGSAPTWGPDGRVYYFDESGRTLMRVLPGGGSPEVAVRLDSTVASGGFAHPHVLPDGRAVIVTALPADQASLDQFSVHVMDLASGASRASVAGVFGIYAPSGHLLYVSSGGVLTAVRFDAGAMRLTGVSVGLIEGVEVRGPGNTDVSVSNTGTLAYATPSVDTPEGVVWVSPSGDVDEVDPTWTTRREYEGIALSPDATRLALAVITTGRSDIWIKELQGGPWGRLIPGGAATWAPAWSADGASVAFVSWPDDQGTVRIKAADGSAPDRPLVSVGRPVWELHWSADGAWLLMSVEGPPSFDILGWRVGRDSVPVSLVAGEFDEFSPALSADGRWLAYASNESGRVEVYVRPFPEVGSRRRQISPAGGADPIWSRQGQRLFFRPLDPWEIHVADLAQGLGAATPRLFLRLPAENDYERNQRDRIFDLAPDGRFVMIERVEGFGRSGDLVIVQNFFRELRDKVGT